MATHPLSVWRGQFSTWVSLLPAQVQIQYHCGREAQAPENTSKAPGSRSSRDGKVLPCKHNQIVSENKEMTFGRICHKWTAMNGIILALWGEEKRAVLLEHSLEHTLYQKRICSE